MFVAKPGGLNRTPVKSAIRLSQHILNIQAYSQARNQLGTPGQAKSFLWGDKFFWTMS